MALCEVVAEIADSILAAGLPLTAHDAVLLHIVKGMPLYRDINRLDAWESALNDTMPADPGSTTTSTLIQELIMLGQCNLYQQFQPQRTLAYYTRLIPIFSESGVNLPAAPDLSKW